MANKAKAIPAAKPAKPAQAAHQLTKLAAALQGVASATKGGTLGKAATKAAAKASNAASIAAALQLPNGIATQVATPAAAVAKLTKRSPVLVGQLLVTTGKPVKVRATQNAAAWAQVVAAIGTKGATATQLVALPALAHPACVSPQAFISYMLRRGYLAVKA